MHYLQNTSGGYAQYRYDKKHKCIPPIQAHITRIPSSSADRLSGSSNNEVKVFQKI